MLSAKNGEEIVVRSSRRGAWNLLSVLFNIFMPGLNCFQIKISNIFTGGACFYFFCYKTLYNKIF